MIAPLALALLAAALPEGAARYRVELSGEVIGAAELAVRCAGDTCALSWETALRAPAEAGGALRRRRVASTVDRAGRLTGPVELREDGAARPGRAVAGRVPSAAAELVLLAAGAGRVDAIDEETGAVGPACPRCVDAFDEETGAIGLACARCVDSFDEETGAGGPACPRCVDAFDEETGAVGPACPRCVDAFDEETGAIGLACARSVDAIVGEAGAERACARRLAGALRAEVLGEREELLAGADGFPDEVRLPGQGVRYLRDPAAAAPARPPRLAVRVPGPSLPAAARRFCGLAADPTDSGAPPAGAPPARPTGASCRVQAEAYAAAAARAGLRARVAVGVAHDGAGFAWHAWAEVCRGGRWVPVDPALGQAPARGPRFTVDRYDAADAAARARAGRRILACWGRGGVE